MTSRYHAHGFVDGGYLRELALSGRLDLPNPRLLVQNGLNEHQIGSWASDRTRPSLISLTRVTYYDARPDGAASSPGIEKYWDAIERLPDTQLGFGTIRGRKRRQKKVDSLIAVDMLVGAFTQVYQVGVLVAGDADFVPVVEEVKRRGVMVALFAEATSAADELQRAADRVWLFNPAQGGIDFPPLQVDGKTIAASEAG